MKLICRYNKKYIFSLILIWHVSSVFELFIVTSRVKEMRRLSFLCLNTTIPIGQMGGMVFCIFTIYSFCTTIHILGYFVLEVYAEWEMIKIKTRWNSDYILILRFHWKLLIRKHDREMQGLNFDLYSICVTYAIIFWLSIWNFWSLPKKRLIWFRLTASINLFTSLNVGILSFVMLAKCRFQMKLTKIKADR